MTILYDNRINEEFGQAVYDLIESVTKATLEHEEHEENVEISVSFVDNEEIKELNKEYRGIDRVTDVLSFSLMEGEDTEYSVNPETGDTMLGDIVICIDKTREQANEYGHTFERELGFLVVHSMLHLLGYDHMEVEEENVMFRKQEEILNKVGLVR